MVTQHPDRDAIKCKIHKYFKVLVQNTQSISFIILYESDTKMTIYWLVGILLFIKDITMHILVSFYFLSVFTTAFKIVSRTCTVFPLVYDGGKLC